MRRIAVFTGARAEYGLLYWLMKDLQADPDLELQLLVSGMHLSPEFGNTYEKILDDGFVINEKVEMLLSSDTPQGIAKSLGIGVIGFTDALTRLAPDLIVILGDRFEALAVAQTAMLLRIPIAHIHGGEITEGAYDDSIRHAITKLSYLHFTSTEDYRKRVIQLGEHPERVVNVGAIGLDALTKSPVMSLEELSGSLDIELSRPYFLVTYHPVTLADEDPEESFQVLLDSLDKYKDHQVIITYPNADDGGRKIIPMLESYAAKDPQRVLAIPSLGQKRYLSAVKHAAAVVGNSSSGIIEVPAFGVPTVNIGDRQKGRLAAKSVINCRSSQDSITSAISAAISGSYRESGETITNPYGQGSASEQIVNALKNAKLDVLKSFYDLNPD